MNGPNRCDFSIQGVKDALARREFLAQSVAAGVVLGTGLPLSLSADALPENEETEKQTAERLTTSQNERPGLHLDAVLKASWCSTKKADEIRRLPCASSCLAV